jgi:hypothetical protein
LRHLSGGGAAPATCIYPHVQGGQTPGVELKQQSELLRVPSSHSLTSNLSSRSHMFSTRSLRGVCCRPCALSPRITCLLSNHWSIGRIPQQTQRWQPVMSPIQDPQLLSQTRPFSQLCHWRYQNKHTNLIFGRRWVSQFADSQPSSAREHEQLPQTPPPLVPPRQCFYLQAKSETLMDGLASALLHHRHMDENCFTDKELIEITRIIATCEKDDTRIYITKGRRRPRRGNGTLHKTLHLGRLQCRKW